MKFYPGFPCYNFFFNKYLFCVTKSKCFWRVYLYSQSVRLGICSLGGFCRRIQDTCYRIQDTGNKIHYFPMSEGTIMFPRVVTYNFVSYFDSMSLLRYNNILWTYIYLSQENVSCYMY